MTENEAKQLERKPRKLEGRELSRKSVGDDKVTGISSIADNSITTAMLQSAAVVAGKLSYETVSITIAGAATSGTATVVSGDVIVGYYLSAFTGTPAASYVKLAISGTTLTATLTTAPGAGNDVTIVVFLLKA